MLVCFFLFPLTILSPLSLLFLSFHHCLSPSLSISGLLLSLSFRLSPDSQATSGWPSELTVSTGNIMGGLCHHNILRHFTFWLGYPFVLRSARCHSQGVENVSVSPCPHQYHHFWNTHIATMEMTPPWGGLCPGWWQLYGSNMNKMLNYLANCF